MRTLARLRVPQLNFKVCLPRLFQLSILKTDDELLVGSAANLDTFVNDPNECLREHTVAALWDRIQQVGVVHVRGTPASGKSTLSKLLERYVRRQKPGLQVLWCSWPIPLPGGLDQSSQHDKILNYVFDRPAHTDWQNIQALIIIDEAQASYACVNVWNAFIKAITPSSGPKVVLFSSYGSPSEQPLGSDSPTPTPIYFRSDQRISIRRSSQNPDLALLFSRTEFDDVVERVCKHHSQYGQAFHLSLELVDYLWEITNGHPAGVRAVLDELASSEVCIDWLSFPSLFSSSLSNFLI